jgi:N-acylneuraminate cytidylyltransferase
VAPVNYEPAKRPLRQELKEEIWEENGSFYIFKPWVLRKLNSRLGGQIAMHKMSRLNSFQIDEPGDFELIEHLMAFGKAESRKQKTESGEQRAEDGGQRTEDGGQRAVVNGQLSCIKLLVLDFDGVLTDNRVLVSEDGIEAVLCDRSDGLGLERLKRSGIEVIVLSKEKNPVVAARCRKLGIECIQGCDDKLEALKKRAEGGNLKPEKAADRGDFQPSAFSLQPSPAAPQVSGLILHPSPAGPSGFRSQPSSLASSIAYVGNDVNDLECLRWVGLPIAVAGSAPEVLAAAKWVTSKPGGHGAVREICDLLLRAM